MTLEDTIHIEAPADVVWAVTEDIERWPEWTPTVTAARRLDDRPFGIGSRVRIKQPAQAESDWTVTEYVRGHRFAWTTRRPGLRMTASHEVCRHESGAVNVLRVEVSGVTALALWPILRIAIRHALAKENRGMKARCEATSVSMRSS
jgi:uncharacterized membrane protein